MDANPEDLSSSLKEIDEKMSTFSSILEKFGLDIITKMGQTNLKITQLTDMVEDLNKSTIEIKGLKPQLNNVIQNQKLLEEEISLIKSLIINITAPSVKKNDLKNTIVRDESVTGKKDLIINQLNDLRTKLENDDDDNPQVVRTILEQIKEEIYEFTGGHRMLYEISQILTRLDSAGSLDDLMDEQNSSSKSIKSQLIENITFWVNKLMIKD